jgi:hypothetical protein
MGAQQEKKTPENTERFTLPKREKNFWPWDDKSYPIDKILDDVIDYYIKDEDDVVKTLFNRNCIKGNINVRQFLVKKIQELNEIEDTISSKTNVIFIPTNKIFFETAFPEYLVLRKEETTISVGVLDKLDYQKELEEIVCGIKKPEDITDPGAGRQINWALHNLKIHTCPPDSPSFYSLLESVNTKPVIEGIKIFQREYMNRQTPQGQICGETLRAINQALTDNWTRDLYFYYKKPIGDESFELYINDADIDNGIYDSLPKADAEKMFPANNTMIYAKKKGEGQETYLGKVVFYPSNSSSGRRGIQHVAEKEFIAHTAKEKIYSGVVKSEGKGYDTINMYDRHYLSIGMLQWGWDELYKLLVKFKFENDSDFKQLISNDYKLDVNHETDTAKKRFIIDNESYSIVGHAPHQIKQLKFAYCFIKATDNVKFRELQESLAAQRVPEVLNISIKGKPITSYVTSEKGLAFVYDHHVNAPDYVATCVEKAVNEVIKNLQEEWNEKMLSSLNTEDRAVLKEYFKEGSLKNDENKKKVEGFVNNPNNWGNYEEELFIVAYKTFRIDTNISGMDKKNAETRNSNIEAVRPALSSRRKSINLDELRK